MQVSVNLSCNLKVPVNLTCNLQVTVGYTRYLKNQGYTWNLQVSIFEKLFYTLVIYK